MDDICEICGENEADKFSRTCSDKACKITRSLFVWRVKVFKGEKPPKGAKAGCSGGLIQDSFGVWKSYNWYWYYHSSKKLKAKLKEVRAKIYLLDKMKSYDEIIKALNTNFCNQIKYSIKITSYEKQHATFDSL